MHSPPTGSTFHDDVDVVSNVEIVAAVTDEDVAIRGDNHAVQVPTDATIDWRGGSP